MSTKYKPRLTWDVNKKVWWCEGYNSLDPCVAFYTWRLYGRARIVNGLTEEALKQLKELYYGN